MKPTIQHTLAALAATSALAFATPALGEAIYKWVDEKGITQYGSRPPAGKSDNALLIKGQSVKASRRPGSTLYEGEVEETGAEADAETEAEADADADLAAEGATAAESAIDAAVDAQAAGGAEASAGAAGGAAAQAPKTPMDKESAGLEAKVRAHNCAKARETLKVLNENARVKVPDEKGNMVFLTQPQMEERKKQAQQVAAENC